MEEVNELEFPIFDQNFQNFETWDDHSIADTSFETNDTTRDDPTPNYGNTPNQNLQEDLMENFNADQDENFDGVHYNFEDIADELIDLDMIGVVYKPDDVRKKSEEETQKKTKITKKRKRNSTEKSKPSKSEERMWKKRKHNNIDGPVSEWKIGIARSSDKQPIIPPIQFPNYYYYYSSLNTRNQYYPSFVSTSQQFPVQSPETTVNHHPDTFSMYYDYGKMKMEYRNEILNQYRNTIKCSENIRDEDEDDNESESETSQNRVPIDLPQMSNEAISEDADVYGISRNGASARITNKRRKRKKKEVKSVSKNKLEVDKYYPSELHFNVGPERVDVSPRIRKGGKTKKLISSKVIRFLPGRKGKCDICAKYDVCREMSLTCYRIIISKEIAFGKIILKLKQRGDGSSVWEPGTVVGLETKKEGLDGDEYKISFKFHKNYEKFSSRSEHVFEKYDFQFEFWTDDESCMESRIFLIKSRREKVEKQYFVGQSK